MASGAAKVVRGSFKGTGSNIDITVVGFRPRSVKLWNQSGLATAEWTETMADGSMVKRITAGTMTFPTTGGITPLAAGFRLGNGADMNVSGEKVHFEAIE